MDFDALVTSYEAAKAAYDGLLNILEKCPKGKEFLKKIDQALFKKMFIEFFSNNPEFNPNQEIQIKQSRKYDSAKSYVSNKLRFGGFKYKVRSYPDGQTHEGTFNPATGQLTQGKKTFASGNIHEGTFDPTTRKLTQGKVTFANGQVQEGTFDAEGKCTPSDMSAVIAAAQQAVENANTLAESLQEKYHFDPPTTSAATAAEA